MLRRKVSELSGLPVGVFRLVTKTNMELFDRYSIQRYREVVPGCIIRLDIWNGWSNIINTAIKGDTRKFLTILSKARVSSYL